MIFPLEAVVKAPPEGILTKKTPMEKPPMMDAISHLEEASTVKVEIGESSEQVVPIKYLPPIDSQASPSQSTHSILSVMESLKSVVVFLEIFLSSAER